MIATVLFIYIIYDLFIYGKVVSHNPWDMPVFFTKTIPQFNELEKSETLEWTINSPIPFHAYEEVPVQS